MGEAYHQYGGGSAVRWRCAADLSHHQCTDLSHQYCRGCAVQDHQNCSGGGGGGSWWLYLSGKMIFYRQPYCGCLQMLLRILISDYIWIP